MWHLADTIALPHHGCISSCHHCILSISCEFRCIRFLYAARARFCRIKWWSVQRCSCADTTAPLKKNSLRRRLQNLRTVRVPHSFSQKPAQISRRVERILSRDTRNCIFLLFTCVPKTRTIKRGSLVPCLGRCRSRGCVVCLPPVESELYSPCMTGRGDYLFRCPLEGRTILNSGLLMPSSLWRASETKLRQRACSCVGTAYPPT